MKKTLITLLVILIAIPSFSKKKPNVIVVLADDVGTGDISFYRKKHSQDIKVETPNLDKIASQAMVFTNAHSPAALCAPSRYAIMTGNSCYRSNYPWGVWGAYEKSPLKEDQLTLGKLMKEAGYNTAFFGKWHLGGDYRRKDNPEKIYRGPRWKPELDVDITEVIGGDPLSNGFDYSFMYPAGIQDVPYAVYENNKWMPLADDSEITFISKENMLKKDVKLDKSEGLGDSNWDAHNMGPLLVAKGVNYINEQASEKNPFFMYYCSQAVHLPHTPPDSLNGIAIKGTTPSHHLDMIKEMDVQMGMLVDALKENGEYDNTIFIFTSDNGGLTFKETMQTGHRPSNIYRGGKNQIHEGGHRVPFIVSWPNEIKKGSSDEPILGLDIMSTLAHISDLTIAENQAMDSHNLWPILNGSKNAKGHPYLMVQGGTAKEVAIIEDGWKLIIQIDKKDKTDNTRTPKALFNLINNPGEKQDQNKLNDPEQKGRVKKLFDKYNRLRDGKEATAKR